MWKEEATDKALRATDAHAIGICVCMYLSPACTREQMHAHARVFSLGLSLARSLLLAYL